MNMFIIFFDSLTNLLVFKITEHWENVNHNQRFVKIPCLWEAETKNVCLINDLYEWLIINCMIVID